MFCVECGREISDESIFCMYCGSEQDFEESDADQFADFEEDLSKKRRDALAPGQKESELLTSLRKGRRGRFSDPLTISLIAISSVLLVAFLALLFGRPAWERAHFNSKSSVAETFATTSGIISPTEADKPAVMFSVPQIQLAPGEQFDLSGVITIMEDVPLRWTSSSSVDIDVDSAGIVSAHVPGSAVTIEVGAQNGGYVSQTVRIICLSEEAEALIEETRGLNNRSDDLAEIDTRTILYRPSKRNTELFWNKTLFYSLEDFPENENDGRINSYTIEKRKMKVSGSENAIDYEIYRSPSLGLVHKIVSIEYLPGDMLEITEYYFESNGDLNFVFVHKDTSYTPSRPAAPNIYGDRYYFNEDVMVKWRTVDATVGVRDVIIGENEKRNSASAYSYIMYSEAEESMCRRFDELEKNVLNKAYITYFTVLSEKESSRILGSVTDEKGVPLADASVTLICPDMNDTELYRAVTNEKGRYSIIIPSGNKRFALRVGHEGAVPVRVMDIASLRSDMDTYMETIKMIPFSESVHSIRVVVIDAVNKAEIYREDEFNTEMLRIPEAEIRFREGIGNVNGEVVQTAFSDMYGIAAADLPTGVYTAEVSVFGYETSSFTVCSYPNALPNRFCLSPTLGKGEIRIVLSWSVEPEDLDAHLFTPFGNPDTGTESHIWFRSQTDEAGNRLDVDATAGFGPETVTIADVAEGVYKYYVTNFTDCIASDTSSKRLSYSAALVQVFSENGRIASFHVPAENEGVIWEVFEIRNGSVVPIDRYYSNIADKPWWNTDKTE